MNIDKTIALGNSDVQSVIDTINQQNKDFNTFSKLSPVGKRKMLKRMEQRLPLEKMSYAQAKLFHRLKGRIGK